LWRNWWNEHWQGKPNCLQKTCPSATLSTTNPTRLDPGLNPARRCGKPATNHLSYGAALPSLRYTAPSNEMLTQTVPKSVTCESVRNKDFVQVLSLDVAQTSSNDSHNRAGNTSPLHLMTEIDSVSVNLFERTHNMKNNSHVYC
jgi:hypothetical protein